MVTEGRRLSEAVGVSGRGAAALFALLAFLFLAAACTAPLEQGEITQLEVVEVGSPLGAVSTGYEEATRAGVEMLKTGGNAVDAAVAAAFVAGAASPGSSGLAGTTYILIRMADGRTVAIDGSARVPLRVDRKALTVSSPDEQLFGVKVAAVPGTLAALDRARAEYGSKTLAELLAPAIAVADAGFVLNDSKCASIAKYVDTIRQDDQLRQLLLQDGWEVPEPGTRIVMKDMAVTLRRLAERGADDFYRGEIAAEIVADMRRRGGFVTAADLAAYRVRERSPLRGSYRGTEVLAFPWPSSGAAVIEALNMLESFPRGLRRAATADRLQAVGESFHIALEDHYRFTASASLTGQAADLSYLGKSFAAERARLIRFDRPLSVDDLPPALPAYLPQGGTTQVSVVDRFGNVVSLTQTLGRFFGGKALADPGGFLYNSFLEGFNPADPKAFQPRAACPTDMSPTIVLSGDRLLVALGSAASERIPGVVAFVIDAMVDGGMGLGEAVLAPRVLWNAHSQPEGLIVEVRPPISEGMVEELERRGYRDMFLVGLPATRRDFIKLGSVNAVSWDPVSREYRAVADPRREGSAAGVGF